MKKKDAIQFFETQEKLAKALGISQAAVGEWGEDVPDLRQLQLEALTNGKLQAAARLKKPGKLSSMQVIS